MTDTAATGVPAAEIERRIAGLQAHLDRLELDAALLAQNTDLYYFAGTIQQAHLYVPREGEPLLLVRKHLPRAAAESPLRQVAPLASPREIPRRLADAGLPAPRRLGLELDVLPARRYLGLCRLWPDARMVDVSDAVRRVRAVKSPFEMERVCEAARRADAVAAAVPGLLRAGISEIELAGRVEAEARRLGHQGIVRMRLWGGEMFYGHLMSGPDAAMPSFLASPTGGRGLGPEVAQGPGLAPIAAASPVLVDYVFAHGGYLADHTRIFSVGRLSARLERAHEAMCRLQDELMPRCRPGVPAGEIYRWAVARAAEMGYAEWFMGAEDDRIRFVGHGIGLELDEYPFLAEGQEQPLAEGMIIALEPKLVFPGEGVVGIENTHRVTAGGLERLTRFPDGIGTV